MTEPTIGLLLVIPGNDTKDMHPLGQALASRIGQAVVLCPEEAPGELLVAGIRALVGSGVQRLVVMPLLPSAPADQSRLAAAIQWASRRWPFLTFHAAAPLGWQEWACVVGAAARDALATLAPRPTATAVLIAGPGSPDPLANADLARLTHLVSEAGEFACVDYAFLASTRPAVPEAVALLARLGLRNVVLVPWLMSGDPLGPLSDQVEQARRLWDLRVKIAARPQAHPALLDLLISHYQAALQDDSLLAPSWDKVLAEIARSAGTYGHGPGQAPADEEEAQLRELDRKINDLLPPQYQGRYEEVSARSMGTAPLQFGPDGRVAWDEMWTTFCDLALAGGPAHRGTLLEAVPTTEALAEPEKYQAVVAEIERGIKLVTGLPVVPSKIPGWVAIRCDSEDMAIWLMRAIIVENVMVRREGDVIYLPAGPQFTVKREIKNVVTVVAKTCHYWTAHLVARRRPGGSASIAPALATSAPAGGGP